MAESDNDRKVAALPEDMALPDTSDPDGQRRALEQECQRLRAERDLLRILIDHVPAYVFAKDRDSRFLTKNRAGARWLGFDSPEQVVGKTPHDLYPPALAEQLLATDRQVLDSGQPLENHEYEVQDTTGRMRWLRTSKVPFRDPDGTVAGLVGISVDITEARQIALELQESEQRFRDITEVSADIIWETDAELRYTLIAGRYRGMTGFSIHESLGKRRGERALADPRVSLEERQRWEAHFAELRAFRAFRNFEFQLSTPRGTRVLQSSGKPFFDANGHFLGYRGMTHDITEAHELRQRLIHQASRDGLTQLLNRNTFFEALHRALARASRRTARVGLFFIDLNRFKPVNDRLGHEAGDRLLRMVAERLRHHVREGDTVARLGGDEFALLVKDSDDRRELAEVAEKLLRLFGEPFRLGIETIELGAAIGISCYPEDGTEPMTLLHRADQAMYRAKALGGCHYRFHETA